MGLQIKDLGLDDASLEKFEVLADVREMPLSELLREALSYWWHQQPETEELGPLFEKEPRNQTHSPAGVQDKAEPRVQAVDWDKLPLGSYQIATDLSTGQQAFGPALDTEHTMPVMRLGPHGILVEFFTKETPKPKPAPVEPKILNEPERNILRWLLRKRKEHLRDSDQFYRMAMLASAWNARHHMQDSEAQKSLATIGELWGSRPSLSELKHKSGNAGSEKVIFSRIKSHLQKLGLIKISEKGTQRERTGLSEEGIRVAELLGT